MEDNVPFGFRLAANGKTLVANHGEGMFLRAGPLKLTRLQALERLAARLEAENCCADVQIAALEALCSAYRRCIEREDELHELYVKENPPVETTDG